MKSKIKKVVTKKGNVMYYRGDGLWFGRTSRIDAEHGLATGEYTLWETVNKWLERYTEK